MSAPGSLRSAPQSVRGRRGFHRFLGLRGILWFLGFLGFSTSSAADAGSGAPSTAAVLEARVKAARQVLARPAIDPLTAGHMASGAPPADGPANLLAQWLNAPDWRNWGNWPNWFNQ